MSNQKEKQLLIHEQFNVNYNVHNNFAFINNIFCDITEMYIYCDKNFF